jgi:5,10-methylenetetrahydromethanopterin reductase
MVATNGWDPQVLARFRADDVVASVPGAIDAKADVATLEHVAGLIPDEWLEPAATGSARRCAERVLRQFDLGVDGVIMHGATPDELAPVVAAYRDLRPTGRFAGLAANPGRTAAR